MPSPLDEPTIAALKSEAGAIRRALDALDRALAPKALPSAGVGAPRTPVEKTKPSSQEVDAGVVRTALEALEAELAAFRGALDGTRTGTDTLAATSGPSGSSSAPNADLRTSFGDFISSVGRSVADAQAELDQQARAHLAASRGQGGPLLPTLYRIPKLSAEVKFAFGKETGKGLNLLFFSKKEKSSEEHQQSITFDIVAVPPPTELVEQLASGVPAIRLVLESDVRERVFKVVRDRARADLPEADRETLDAVLGTGTGAISNDANRVLILESVPNDGPEYVMVLAGSDPNGDASTDIGIWHVSLAGSTKVAAALKFKQIDVGRVNQAPLRSLMATLADQQAKVLAAAERASKT